VGVVCLVIATAANAQISLQHVPETLEPGPMRIEQIWQGLYVIRGPFLPCAPNGCTPGGNDDGLHHESGDVALLVTPEGLMLVDDKFPNHVESIMDMVRSVSPLPVRYVLNTHHHGDHVSGNVVFREQGIDVIGHQNIRANFLRIQQPGEPNITFDHDAAVFLGGIEVRMLYFGKGHTDGDTVVYFPDYKVVHAGDLIIDGMPVIDYGAGGSAVEFVRTIDALLALDFDVLIPGHGRLMNRDDVVAYRSRFAEMNRRMRDLVRRGVPKSDARVELHLEELGWNNTVSTTTWEAISFDGYYDEMGAE
jgi:glyoxylase-like metal-dependent hydrolase (beta-lactamase superfamily II)